MIISESIVINAPLKKVWNTFTDLSCWKEWSKVVSKVSSETERLTQGKSFKFCIRPFAFPVNVEPKVEELISGQKIVWRGSRHGIKARHEFLFEEKDGKTLITSREIFSMNLFKRFLLRIPKKRLHRLSVMLLQDLKHACEDNVITEKIKEY